MSAPSSGSQRLPDTPPGEAFCFLFCPAETGAAARLALFGELDVTSAGRARAAFRCAQERSADVVCDLAGVTFVDVSGLCLLLDTAARARHDDTGLTFMNCPEVVASALRLFGLADHLEPGARPLPAHSRWTRPHVGHVRAAQAGRRQHH